MEQKQTGYREVHTFGRYFLPAEAREPANRPLDSGTAPATTTWATLSRKNRDRATESEDAHELTG
jgi:hypothetical protein